MLSFTLGRTIWIVLALCSAEQASAQTPASSLPGSPAPLAALQSDKKAFENLNFGDSKKTIQEKLKRSTKLKPLFYGKTPIVKGFIDGEYSLELGKESFKAYFDFQGDKLATLSFYSWPRDASFYDTLVKEAWQAIREVALARFGKPSKELGYPSFLALKNGYSISSDIWLLADREVRVGVGCDDATYYAVLNISDNVLNQKKKAVEAAEQKKAKQEAVDGL